MREIIFSGILALAIAPGIALAQFKLPSIISGNESSSGGAQADLGGQQTALVKNFVAANIHVLKANAQMSEALGLKDKAADADAVVQALSSGATVDKDSASKAATAVSDTGGAIQAKLAEKPVLDAKAKAQYAQGLASLASGVIKYSGLGKDVTAMGNSLKSAPLTQMPSLGAAVYVVGKFPQSVTDLTTTLKNAMDFARSNDIAVPSDATEALSQL